MLRVLLCYFLLAFSLSAWSDQSIQTPQVQSKKKSDSSIQDKQDSDKLNKPTLLISKTIPDKINANDSGQKSENDGTEFWHPFFGFRFRITDSLLVLFTGILAYFTSKLVQSTNRLWEEAKTASNIAKQSADTAKESAQLEFVSSMPILSPLVVSGPELHPLDPASKNSLRSFKAIVHLVFENFGKTPAIIKSLRVLLVLNEGESFTPFKSEHLSPINYNPIIGPNVRKDAAMIGVAEHHQYIGLPSEVFNELLAEAYNPPYRRFDLVGEVIYEDFFQTVYTRRFCVKLRYFWGLEVKDGIGVHVPALFQLVRGSGDFNSIEYKKKTK